MKKISLIVLLFFVFSISAPKPSYAWKGGMMIVGLVTAPFWLPIALVVSKTRDVLNSRSEKHKIEEAQKSLRKFYSAVRTQIKNDRELYSAGPDGPAFDPDRTLLKVIRFLDAYLKVDDSEMAPSSFLCLFRRNLLANLPENSLKPEMLAQMFEKYEETGTIPSEFIAAAQENLKLTPAAAERVFSIMYGTTLAQGIEIRTFGTRESEPEHPLELKFEES